MALPKLLQKLFTNGGAGDKLNQDIIPDIPYSKVTGAPVVDSALSSTSENPVQNKVINSALDGKLSTSGGTMTGNITFSGDATKIESAQNNGGKVEVGSSEVGLLSNKDNYEGGATLLLRSSSYGGQNGYFYLISALSASQRHDLVGKPDGSLTWSGASVWCGNAKWANRTNLTIGQSFTAPSRGFVYSRGNSTSSWGALRTSVNGIHLLGWTGKETDTGGTVYVNAGDTVIVSKTGTVEHTSVIFVPIQ